ncbi:hypothetical protein A3C09_00755 [Candidatus Uhrbacteria bacterium RIFCSPHIGHO2_02_FULL_47_44]|uniref:DAGKc domain-containing protein n=1 Tax=Candidatus Uhrbacteria bacterium RIFCSPLOWO2_02_FULL_48_18 TaxID=1802408 RepID=A0A1F7VBY7_9BACT|nr:MAG: hypothetical protein A3C09_00755 [Candidatus Uhrbacteria bacterium RIFCSPHIGHO2_02_FULL_47_44]OGL77663.1 MAG: hypothetical protein A3E97_03980 [Candidatus Uhrbacteria bacterium RIFCSPHIGHO2_12_FULL_47_12]OGL82404.1 MAG: hypothetical protein A3B20_01465 [Candidatus Uhrbacteria bacterium RIFCSPLOWO2_01_FULL_47_17]OGL88050.1 MAG: hypothetical protein A3I41_02995 [Candidatus Uhrbacteria bacterium RIFCSPLOWO2_02_FULL_48_18]OGL93720.1 MAG: hypothetical protein A3H12_00980 [Candidatus Uhrbacte
MDHLIVMNPFARHMRKDRTLRTRLRSLVRRPASVIEPQSVDELIKTMKALGDVRGLADVTVYIVGGDGTFNQVLNWVMTLPAENRPRLMPVGGGQFNFMTKFVGLKSTDPSVNLAKIFSGDIETVSEPWKSIRIHHSTSNETRFAAVVANGILCDAVEWYEEVGKGDMADVVKLIGAMVADFAKNMIHGRHGRIKPTRGDITINHNNLGVEEYAAFMFGTVPEFLPGCRPFLSPPNHASFSAMVYSGNLASLAASVPLVWNGWASPLTDLHMFNADAEHVVVKTKDPRLLVDGDLHTWPVSEQHPTHILTITHSEPIQLLHAVS